MYALQVIAVIAIFTLVPVAVMLTFDHFMERSYQRKRAMLRHPCNRGRTYPTSNITII